MSSAPAIELLADHPDALPILQVWFEQEWAPYYGPGGPGDARHDLLASCNRNELPLALVALLDGKVCGTAALKKQSVNTHSHLTPWLAALLVGAPFRRRGIATNLIAGIEEMACQFGFPSIYVGTGSGPSTPEPTLRRRGWVFLEKTPYYVSDVSIFRKTFE